MSVFWQPSSLVIGVIPFCIYLDMLQHAFHIYIFPLLLCNFICYMYDIFFLISDTYFLCMTVSNEISVYCFSQGKYCSALHSWEPEMEDFWYWIFWLWIKFNLEWEKTLPQGTINSGSTVVDVLLLIPKMLYISGLV